MALDSAELDDLRENWKWAVCLGRPLELGLAKERPLPCWFGANVPGIDPCEEGPRGIEGAHWLKRQAVERTIRANLLPPEMVWAYAPAELVRSIDEYVLLAAWDPRNGVPACQKHHQRFDGTRVDATNELVIWRHEVPKHVEAFALDWGLESALEDRNPPIGGGI